MAQPGVKPPYIRKPKCWTDTDMENALKEVLSGQSSIRGAASRHGLNESSVRHRLKRLAAGKKIVSSGRLPAFDSEVECALAKNVQAILNQGANVKADEVLDMIADYLRKNNICTTVFKDGRPGKDWLRSFLARNKLSLKMPSKDGQVVMTVCKGCQELGPPPSNLPQGKKWVRAWALVDDPSFLGNNPVANGKCSVKNGEASKPETGNIMTDTERNIPIKNEEGRFTIDQGCCDAKNEKNNAMNNEITYLNIHVENKCSVVNGGGDSPSNNEHTLFVPDEAARTNVSENEHNHLGMAKGNKDVKILVERNDDIDMHPTVYILNSNDTSAVMRDVESTLPTENPLHSKLNA